MKKLFLALLAVACASNAIACGDATGGIKEAPRGYYRDASGRSCYEASFMGKIYRSCY